MEINVTNRTCDYYRDRYDKDPDGDKSLNKNPPPVDGMTLHDLYGKSRKEILSIAKKAANFAKSLKSSTVIAPSFILYYPSPNLTFLEYLL